MLTPLCQPGGTGAGGAGDGHARAPDVAAASGTAPAHDDLTQQC